MSGFVDIGYVAPGYTAGAQPAYSLFNPIDIQGRIADVLRRLCGGLTSILRHNTVTLVNHIPSGTSHVDYAIYAVLDRIHQIENPRGGERITTQLVYAAAATGVAIPEDEMLTPATEWQFIDVTGVVYNVAASAPVRPINNVSILYQLDVAR